MQPEALPALGLRHLLSARELAPERVRGILDRARKLQLSRQTWPRLDGIIVGLVFLEPSTRTRFGFHAAAARLGATAIELSTPRHTPSMSAAESLADTLRTLSGYCDLLVVRHRDHAELLAAVAAARVPVINGGSGTVEHPTQALIDLFAIRNHFGRIADLRIGLVGALSTSRAAASLLTLLAHEPPAELRLMAPPALQLTLDRLLGFGAAKVRWCDRLEVDGLDVLYAAGLPEGTTAEGVAEPERRRFRVTPAIVERLAAGAMLLCPLPRIDEIALEVDALPAARYFAASDLGLYVRMTLLDSMEKGQ